MECPHCGAKLEEFDSFCPACGEYALPLQNTEPPEEEPVPEAEETSSAPRKVPTRLYPPPEHTDDTADASEAPEKPPKNPANRRLVILTIIFGILAAAAIGAAAYVLIHTNGLQVQLRKAQTEQASAEATVQSLQTKIEALQESLDSTRTERSDLSDQVDELSGKINAMESSVNQSEYDKQAAQRELSEAEEELQTLSDSITELQTQLTDTQADLEESQAALEESQAAQEKLQEENDSLTASVSAYQDETAFYDSYVVFVMLSSDTKYYHKYDCSTFTKRNFLAYSTKLAEANGYSPCPTCIGSN
jgi:outer membrane murein-binding lipoprotein Lpp